MAKFQWPAHHVKHARMRDQLWNGHLKRWAWTLKKTGRESIVFFHRSNTAENLPGMWMFFDSLGSSEYGLTTYHFLGWDFRENVSRTFVAWKSRLLLRNMEASLTSWGVQVSAVPATPSRFVHHVVRFASCLGWYRWWFRNPHFAIVWMCSINPVVNHGICFTRLDGSSKTDVSVNESSSSIAAPVIWSHARRFEGSFSWWPEQDIQDGHLYQCGYRANTCMIMCRNYIDTHIYIHLLKHKYIHWHVYIYIYWVLTIYSHKSNNRDLTTFWY